MVQHLVSLSPAEGIEFRIMDKQSGTQMDAQRNAEKQKQSSQTVTSAVIGYLIMFSAYWIVKIIELITGKVIFLRFLRQ